MNNDLLHIYCNIILVSKYTGLHHPDNYLQGYILGLTEVGQTLVFGHKMNLMHKTARWKTTSTWTFPMVGASIQILVKPLICTYVVLVSMKSLANLDLGGCKIPVALSFYVTRQILLI